MGSFTWIEFDVVYTTEATVVPIDGVGDIYDVAINRRGLNLFHGGDAYRDLVARRYTMPLDAERYAQGDTPFSESLQRYFFTGWSDLSGGAGQVMRDRPGSDPTRYYHSQGVNPFDVPGELSLFPEMEQVFDAFWADSRFRLYQAQNRLFAIDIDSDIVYEWDGSVFVDVTPTEWGTASLVDVTSDGVSLYFATTGGIYRLALGATPGTTGVASQWNDKVVGHLSWAFERIIVSSKEAGSPSNNQFWTLGPDGLYDTPGATPGDDSQAEPWLTLPKGWEINDATGGGGFVWFSAHARSKSTVYRWKPDTGDVPQPAWELPANELASSVIHYQGQVLVRASILDEGTAPTMLLDTEAVQPRAVTDETVAARIYQCAVDQAGALVPFLLVSILEDDLNNGNGSWYAGGRFVLFGWSNMDDDRTRSGVGMIDLATGGWCRSLITPPADGVTTGQVNGIIEYNGDLWFAVDGHGVWRTTANRVEEGYIELDAVDKASTLMKSVSDVRVVFDPLPSGASVSQEVSLDRGVSWIDFGWEESNAGAQEMLNRLDRQTRVLKLRTYLRRSDAIPSLGPTVTIQQVQMVQAGLVDEVLELPIDCADLTFGPNRARAVEGRGTGAARSRWLESLSQRDVAVQDADYPLDGNIRVYQVVAVETRYLPRYNEAHGNNEIAAVSMVQMRRPQER